MPTNRAVSEASSPPVSSIAFDTYSLRIYIDKKPCDSVLVQGDNTLM